MNIPDGWRRRDVQASVVLVLISLIVLFVFLAYPGHRGWSQGMLIALWVGWALIPPAYFLYEWSRFTGNSGDLERLKYNHELASKFWIAGVGVLSGVLLTYLKK